MLHIRGESAKPHFLRGTASLILLASLVALPAAPHSAAATPGPFASIVFSRTEISAADNCIENDTNIARLDTEVAPYLQSLGMVASGTLQTAAVMDSSRDCVHYRSSVMASWADAAGLAQNYGWSFLSHTATYPMNYDILTPAQKDAETCGSAVTIDRHGLPGAHGMIAYPGAGPQATELQTDYGSKCFAWGRWYGNDGITPTSAGVTPPYWQHTIGAEGGPCNDSTKSCYNLTPIVSGSGRRYVLPSQLISAIGRLTPANWITIQTFILVKGRSPAYGSSAVAWDCTASDPTLHWTNDNERYCYNDWQTVMQALAAVPGITITDPLTVGVAFGRPATYPPSAISLDVTPPSVPGSLTATAHTSDPGVSLSWIASTDDTGVVGYQVERSTDSVTWTALAARVADTRFTDNSTSYSTRYYYRVKALDAAGNSSGYATTSVTTVASPATRQYVTNPSFENGSLSGWVRFNSTSVLTAVQPAGGAYDGSWAAKVTNPLAAAAQAGIVSSAPQWVSSTTVGATYTASGWLSGAAGQLVRLQLRECTASGSSCPGMRYVDVVLTSGGWVHATVAYTAKASGNGLRFSAYATLPPAGSFLVDAMTLSGP